MPGEQVRRVFVVWLWGWKVQFLRDDVPGFLDELTKAVLFRVFKTARKPRSLLANRRYRGPLKQVMAQAVTWLREVLTTQAKEAVLAFLRRAQPSMPSEQIAVVDELAARQAVESFRGESSAALRDALASRDPRLMREAELFPADPDQFALEEHLEEVQDDAKEEESANDVHHLGCRCDDTVQE